MDIDATLSLDYETQHFGFHPRLFLDNIYSGFLDTIHEALTQLQKYLAEEYKNVISADAVNTSIEVLYQHLVKKLDTAIDRLELYLATNVFVIPEHIVLPEDEVHLTRPCTIQEDENLDKELEKLEQRIKEERHRKQVLKLKAAEQKCILSELEMFENKLQQILTVVTESKSTQEVLKTTLEKCCKLSKKLKLSPELK